MYSYEDELHEDELHDFLERSILGSVLILLAAIVTTPIWAGTQQVEAAITICILCGESLLAAAASIECRMPDIRGEAPTQPLWVHLAIVALAIFSLAFAISTKFTDEIIANRFIIIGGTSGTLMSSWIIFTAHKTLFLSENETVQEAPTAPIDAAILGLAPVASEPTEEKLLRNLEVASSHSKKQRRAAERATELLHELDSYYAKVDQLVAFGSDAAAAALLKQKFDEARAEILISCQKITLLCTLADLDPSANKQVEAEFDNIAELVRGETSQQPLREYVYAQIEEMTSKDEETMAEQCAKIRNLVDDILTGERSNEPTIIVEVSPEDTNEKEKSTTQQGNKPSKSTDHQITLLPLDEYCDFPGGPTPWEREEWIARDGCTACSKKDCSVFGLIDELARELPRLPRKCSGFQRSRW